MKRHVHTFAIGDAVEWDAHRMPGDLKRRGTIERFSPGGTPLVRWSNGHAEWLDYVAPERLTLVTR